MNNKSFCTSNHILVGLGGTGGKILRAFKMRMFEEFPTQDERQKQPVAILYVDSTDEMMPKDGRARPDFRVMGQDASFTQSEFLNIKAVDVEHILNHINNYPTVNSIVDNVAAVKVAIGSLGQAAGQKRRAGRLLFAANAVGYVNSLKDAYARCEKVSGQSEHTNIHILAGLCGGTGSGAIVDAIVQARKTFPDAKIFAYAMIPEMNLPKADIDQGRYYQNGYAAMNELNGLQTGRWYPQDVTGHGKANFYNDRIKGVADGLTIYSNVNENGMTLNSFTELPKTVSDFLFARIFFVNDQDLNANGDIIRAFNFENMDDFALEFDEAATITSTGAIPIARTKKINSFGIKRVMYPELRVLKHITYTVGEKILYQFKYNNWREGQGFVNEERNRDYRRDFLNKENLSQWMLDDLHLTLETKILETDPDYPRFNDYWHDKAVMYADEAKSNKDGSPLMELDNILADFYASHFREDGVEAYYKSKERAINDMAREIRHRLESDLFAKWKIGDMSIVELQKVSKLLLEKISFIRTDLEKKSNDEKDNYAAIDEDRLANVEEWSNLGIIQRALKNGNRLFAEHQNILTEYYVSKTMRVALEFAKKLAAAISTELGKMDVDISSFGQKINDALDETERLVTAQRKVNKGLEDMRGAIIEVSEDNAMSEFEVDVCIDKIDMPNTARQLREQILPQGDFMNFGNLASNISVDDIKDAFDTKLSQIVKTKHDEKVGTDNKVLGLNVLTQLQQQLRTEDDIKAFATKIVSQSGVYLKLNNDQMQLHLRNNEGNLSPTNPASINKKAILVSMPSPDDNEGLKRFADRLETALKNSFNQSTARTTITVNRKSPRKDELSIITLAYCFPMRAIDWMGPYRERYDSFLNTGNPATDTGNAILLHSEGDGSHLPSLFAVDVSKLDAANIQTETQASVSMPPAQPAMADSPLPPPIASAPQPDIKLFIAINGQQYGPYNYDLCKQMVQRGQLTQHSIVWKEGLTTWTPAGQVPELQMLFVPQMPPAEQGMPPLPPVV